MDVQDVADEMVTALGSISGLRAFSWVPGTVNIPAAIIPPPTDITFDETYGRGMDRMTFQVYVVASKAVDRSGTERINGYLSGSGATSIKAKLEGHTYTSCDVVRVTTAEGGTYTIGGAEYLGAMFTVDVGGDGA